MLDWIFEGIVNWVSSVVTKLMDAVSGMFLQALGTDMTTMEEYFPFVSKAFDVMQYTAWALLFLITVWQLFRVFGGPVTEAENPIALLGRSALFAALIGFAKPIFQITLDIATAPYTALMDITMAAEDFTFAGIGQTLSNGLTTIVSIASVVGLLLLIILEISLGWNYFKLLLETVERYVVVGVLCYTSPLAYAMGASKATNNVFKSWCRMVGSQLLLLVLNVWFLRAFNSAMGSFAGNAGALSSGHGSIFLWLFCALAFLKTAQKFDSYLASIGLNVAQTGSSMGMELLMAARVVSGLGGVGRGLGGIFRGAGGAAGAAAGTTPPPTGFAAGFANRFRGNSYVRDAVVNGGERMGAGGTVGFIARAFGGIAARNGAVLTSESISSVASRLPTNSGSIAGDIADRSISNYIPALSGRSLSGTQITGGHISTTSVGADGKQTAVELFSADRYDKPDAPHAVVTAADGSTWYQMASGADAGDFYAVPTFNGEVSEAAAVAEIFPEAESGTMLRSVDDGAIEASMPGESAMLYSAAMYNAPEGNFDVVADADGNDWYRISAADIADGSAVAPQSNGSTAPPQSNGLDSTPSFPGMDAEVSSAGNGVVEAVTPSGNSTMWYSSASYEEPDAPHSVMQSSNGVAWYAMHPHGETPEFESGGSSGADRYNQAQFKSFIPGYEHSVSSVDGSERRNGHFEVRHRDGSGTMFYDTTQFAAPRGDYQVYEDKNGSRWYAIKGQAAIDHKPVYEHGKPVYENGELKTRNVETVRYKNTPSRFSEPKKRGKLEITKPKHRR